MGQVGSTDPIDNSIVQHTAEQYYMLCVFFAMWSIFEQDQVNNADSAIIFLINHWSVRLVRMVKQVQDVKIVQVIQVVQVVQVV